MELVTKYRRWSRQWLACIGFWPVWRWQVWRTASACLARTSTPQPYKREGHRFCSVEVYLYVLDRRTQYATQVSYWRCDSIREVREAKDCPEILDRFRARGNLRCAITSTLDERVHPVSRITDWARYRVPGQSVGYLPRQQGRSTSDESRHIKIRCFFVAHYIATNEINLQYLPTGHMVADILTKPLHGTLFKNFANKLTGNWSRRRTRQPLLQHRVQIF